MAKTVQTQERTAVPYRLSDVTRLALICVTVLAVASCTGDATPTTISAGPDPATTGFTSATSSTVQTLPACRPANPRVGLDLEYESFLADYRFSRPQGIVELIGDGPVHDPWLDPDGEGLYPDIEAWVTAGNDVGDHFINYGYGFGEPFQIFVARRNEILAANGIEEMTLTLDLWANQDCEWRVEVHSPITSPDPCVIDEMFSHRELGVCLGPFPPIAGHHAVWTGTQVLVFGGTSGALDWKASPDGFLFDPSTREIIQVPPAPVAEGWNVHDILWVGERLLVIGQSSYFDESSDLRPSIVAFDPTTGQWSDVTTFPEERQVVGSVVPIGDRLIFIGGDQNGPSAEVWEYSLPEDEWRRLDEAAIPAVEEAEGVWTGAEMIVVGGYAGVDQSLFVSYHPGTNAWESLSDPGYQYIEYHDLYWTGEEVLVAPMHVYTEDLGVHNSLTLLVYDPSTDAWTESSENPAQPPIRGAVTWTGNELLSWGGLSGTWHPTSEGSAYDPATDSWRLLADSPLTARAEHTGTWTGTEWVIIGGSEHAGSPGAPSLSDGAIYDPSSDTWEYLGG